MATYKYFTWPFLFTAVGLALGAWIGFVYSGTVEGTLSVLFICAVLGILEISLSFDNAIVNARILRDMTPVWQRRFLTWGIIIAVFGMRIIFPLAIVAIAAWIDPISALKLAISNPEQYARIMQDAHVGISAFGGTFLLMVGLKFFFDHEKDVHWIRVVESRASRFASVQGIEVGVVLALIIFFSRQLDGAESVTFLTSAIYGLLTFLVVEGLGAILDASQEQMDTVHKFFVRRRHRCVRPVDQSVCHCDRSGHRCVLRARADHHDGGEGDARPVPLSRARGILRDPCACGDHVLPDLVSYSRSDHRCHRRGTHHLLALVVDPLPAPASG